MIVSQKVGFSQCVISTAGRNLVFLACCTTKISRFARNDKLLRLFTKLSIIEKIGEMVYCFNGKRAATYVDLH
jgi:hypothetical protein